MMNNNNNSANIKVAVRLRPLLPDEHNRGMVSSRIKAVKDIN